MQLAGIVGIWKHRGIRYCRAGEILWWSHLKPSIASGMAKINTAKMP
jgi:hypothetical protein